MTRFLATRVAQSVIVLALIAQKYLVHGMTMGAIR